MNINKQSVQDLLENEKDRLCNDLIYKNLLNKVFEIDFTNVSESSQWVIESIQHSENKGYALKLIAENNRCLPLEFYLWNFQVNIYIGRERIQISDDAPVRNDKELEAFLKHLFYLFDSDIQETLMYSGEKLIGYKYEFIRENVIIHEIQHSSFTVSKEKIVIENKYRSWISG